MNIFAWPLLTTISVYRQEQKIILSIDDQAFDLSDALAYNMDTNTVKTARIGISCRAAGWSTWSEARLQLIEGRVRYLFEFEGFSIDIERVGVTFPESTQSEYLWDIRFWVE